MKKLILSLSTLFCVCVLLSSCGKDYCYECASYEDSNGTTIAAKEYCDEGGLLGETAVDASVLAWELDGGTCTKK